MHARLTLDSLAAATPERRVLFSDLTLSVGTECVGIVGRNGSGKSTLLRIVAGELTPSAGTMHLEGSVGMLRQGWPEAWTVAEALGVAEGLAVLERVLDGQGGPDDLDAADWTLEARVAASLLPMRAWLVWASTEPSRRSRAASEAALASRGC